MLRKAKNPFGLDGLENRSSYSQLEVQTVFFFFGMAKASFLEHIQWKGFNLYSLFGFLYGIGAFHANVHPT